MLLSRFSFQKNILFYLIIYYLKIKIYKNFNIQYVTTHMTLTIKLIFLYYCFVDFFVIICIKKNQQNMCKPSYNLL